MVRQVTAARTAVVRVALPIEKAGRMYAQLGDGSAQPGLAESAAYLRTAYDQCREAVAILDQAVDRANTYLASVAGAGSAPTEPPVAISPAPPAGKPWQLTGEQVETLRRELPPPITPAERGTGRKTHGRWVGADGMTRTVVSGADSTAQAAFAWLRQHGVLPVSATHAEMKLAYHLRTAAERTGSPHQATIVVNNRVCAGPLGCATLLPVMLPAGCTLTVHAPNYRRTFTGGAKP
ncbi:MAG TPA: DddA-like double-stranded DNA deaminase toxin [Pseudonocardiaceae bacterium]|nr:DddA-like double-stranded DNA deaminase toxin [Pseudonocardiaceae bacterium]